MKKIIPLFPVPLGVYTFGEIHERQDRQLVSDILKVKSRDEGRVASNCGGWHSHNLLEEEPSFEELSVLICETAREFSASIGCESDLKMTSLWANVNSKGDFNMNHHHVGNALAGVYYPCKSIGDYSQSDEPPVKPGSWSQLGGELTLVDPKYGVNPGLPLTSPSGYNLSHYHVTPTTGLLLLFPSYLVHGVTPQKDETIRVSLSFSLNHK